MTLIAEYSGVDTNSQCRMDKDQTISANRFSEWHIYRKQYCKLYNKYNLNSIVNNNIDLL